MAGRLVVKAGRMGRQAGTMSRNRKGSKPNIQDELAQRDRKHRDKYTGETSATWRGWRQ